MPRVVEPAGCQVDGLDRQQGQVGIAHCGVDAQQQHGGHVRVGLGYRGMNFGGAEYLWPVG